MSHLPLFSAMAEGGESTVDQHGMDDDTDSIVSEEQVAEMGKSKQTPSLTHEEIWDDSALVRSWDEAVEEYQLYHSIHAKGENVEDVLREAEAAGLTEDAEELAGVKMEGEDDTVKAESNDSEMQLDGTAPVAATQIDTSATETPQPTTGDPTPANAPGPTFPAGAMPMPEPALSHVQDESLKRLMMAWYFAGYYTGLYEGQQHAQQQAHQGKS